MSYSIAVLLDRPLLSLTYDTIAAARSGPLADEDETYVPSMLELNATVIIDVLRPLRVNGLSARFSSTQVLEDHEESQAGSVELYAQDSSLLSHAASSPITMPAGRHTFAARFQVPSWLPPTFSSYTSRVTHKVTAQLSQPSVMAYLPALLKRPGKMAVQEVVLSREAPMTLNALRYWSGERRSAATSVAIKTTRFARVNGRLKISMRVKSLEQLHSCKVDIVQDEACSVEMPDESEWHQLPDSTTATTQTAQLPFLSQTTNGSSYTKRKFPMPTISTAFPEPEDLSAEDTEATATLSTLSLEFPVVGNGLQARYESPLLSISHKLRVRIRFYKADVKEIVVNIPITLFEGSASCDDIPPYYEEIYSDNQTRRRTDSVATLPLYTPKLECDTFPQTVRVPTPPESSPVSRCASPGPEDWLNSDVNMRAPAIAV